MGKTKSTITVVKKVAKKTSKVVEEGIIPSSLAADFIADAIGRKYDIKSKTIHDKGRILGPVGLQLPLTWRFSHGHRDKDYFVLCWRVSGDLYLSVAFEPQTYTSTVILMNKRKFGPPLRHNFVTAAGDGLAQFKTLDGYIDYFKTVIEGVWTRSGQSTSWVKVKV